MSATGIHAFDHTISTAIPWMNDLSDRLGWNDRDRAYRAFRSVMHALRDRLSTNQGPTWRRSFRSSCEARSSRTGIHRTSR